MRTSQDGVATTGQAKRWLIIGLLVGMILMAVSIIVAISWPGDVGPAASPEAALRCDEVEAGPRVRDGQVLVHFTCEPPPADPRAVVRDATGTDPGADAVRHAVQELLAGPSAEERAAGFSSAFPPGSEALLIGIELQESGLAVIDFSQELRNAGPLNTAANSFIVFGTLAATIFQFDEVKAIEYRIEGSCVEFARLFETVCQPVLRGN